MTNADIASRANFDAIRYAQLWEDADVLIGALDTAPGATLVSICSAGDNALAMLLLDPARVVAIDLSPAQIACLAIRIAAYKTLDHTGFVELIGSRPSTRRGELLDKVAQNSRPKTRPSGPRDAMASSPTASVASENSRTTFAFSATGCCPSPKAAPPSTRSFAPSPNQSAPPSSTSAGTTGAGS